MDPNQDVIFEIPDKEFRRLLSYSTRYHRKIPQKDENQHKFFKIQDMNEKFSRET